MDEANPISDRYFDLSLRLLTIFVLVAPAPATQSRKPVTELLAPATNAAPAPPDTVLMDPRKTFKCAEKGKATTFSDRPSPCESGSVQILPLNPAQPAAGGR